MKLDDLEKRTLAWGRRHGINNMWSQSSKVTEEWGETVSEMNHGRFGDEFKDGIGDVLVSLTIYTDICGVSITECWERALREVEKRTGETVDGNFIKDEAAPEDERVSYQSY